MKSIRSRLTTSLCLAIGGLLLVAGLLVFVAVREVLMNQFDETLIAKARAIVTAAEIDDGKLEIELSVEDFAGFGDSGDYFEIRRESGKVEMASPSLADPAAQRPPAIGRIGVPDDFEPRVFTSTMADGRRARFFVQRFLPRGGKKRVLFEDLHLVVASPTSELDRNIAGLAGVLSIAGVTMLLVTIPVVQNALKRGLRPLGDLSHQVQRIGPDRLDSRVDESGLPVELQPVAAGLNAWLGRLEETFQRERRFSSHAAHELRTPLAELKMIAESGARWSDEATPERCSEMLEVIDELEGLLDKLSMLARADAGHFPLQLTELDPRGALDAALDRIAPKAAARGIRIIPQIDCKTVVSDPDLLSTILGNLLGNAVAYAPAGSTVAVRVTQDRLMVTNPAPELRQEDLPHLFERFWRKDPSRTGYGHSGLGLSIVSSCAGLMGGCCEAILGSGGELEIRVRWEDRILPTPPQERADGSKVAAGSTSQK